MKRNRLAWIGCGLLTAVGAWWLIGRGDSALLSERFARRVARDAGVPAPLLLGAAFAESRLSLVRADAREQHWVRLAPWRATRTPRAAAALLGVGEDAVSSDGRMGLRGAAVLLARLGREAHVGAGDPLASWRPALQRFSGLPDDAANAFYADEVLAAAARFAGDAAPPPPWPPSVRPIGVVGVDGVPFWAAAPTAHRPEPPPPPPRRVRYIVIHTMQNDFPTIFEFFRRRNTGVGAHYLVRDRDGYAIQMIDERTVAFHDACFNEESIGIEHEGYVDDGARWYSDEMYRASARLVRDIARRWGVPLDRAHILGHGETPDCSDHTDPGRAWDWSRYMKYVRSDAQ